MWKMSSQPFEHDSLITMNGSWNATSTYSAFFKLKRQRRACKEERMRYSIHRQACPQARCWWARCQGAGVETPSRPNSVVSSAALAFDSDIAWCHSHSPSRVFASSPFAERQACSKFEFGWTAQATSTAVDGRFGLGETYGLEAWFNLVGKATMSIIHVC